MIFTLMGLFSRFQKPEQKAAPNASNGPASDSIGGVRKDTDIFKAYIPNFLYQPPYGMPRRDNPPVLKKLSANPYVFPVIKTLADEATYVDWKITVKEEFQETETDGDIPKNDYEEKIKEITRFFQNPNGNDESWNHIMRQLVTDLCEVDSAVLVKIFNRAGEFKQIFSRDGSLFLKNPDIYGYMGDRSDFVAPLPPSVAGVTIDFGGSPSQTQNQIMQQYGLLYRDQAAYFQYGWTAGSMPVPFGKREIVYMMQNPRSDSIYGRSPVAVLQEIILNLIYGVDFNLDFYTNNNMPEGVIQLLGAKQDQIKQFRENWENRFTFKDSYGKMRKKFWKTPISSTEVKYTPFSPTSKDMEVMAQQSWFTKILWMSFGVNADEMGFTENSNKSVGEEQIKTFKRKAIGPILKVIQYHINTQLIPEFFPKGKEDGINGVPDFADVPLQFEFDTYDIDEDIKTHNLLQQEILMGVKTPIMAAKELGINVEELQAELEINEQKEEAKMDKILASKAGNPAAPEDPKKKPEEKSNPLARIERHIDNIEADIINAVEASNADLRIR